jgi:two-component system, sensor histidine kinase YesM
MRRLRFRTQLFLSFGLISVLTAALGFLLVYATSVSLMERQLENASRQRMEQAHFSIGNINRIFSDLSKVIMQDKDVRAAVLPPESNLDRVQRVTAARDKLMPYINSYASIHSVYVIGADGIVLGISRSRTISARAPALSAPLAAAVEKTRSSPQHMAWTGNLSFVDFDLWNYYGQAESIPFVSLVRSYGGGSEPSGYILVNLYMNSYTDLYNNTGDVNGFTLYVCDEDGEIISSANASLLHGRLPSGVLASSAAPPESDIASTTIGGKRYTLARFPDEGWTLVGETLLTEYYASVYRMQLTMLIAFLMTMGSSLAISLYWISRVTRPIRHLGAAMEEIAAGDLSIRVSDDLPDDFRSVGQQFNRMLASLSDLMERNRRIDADKRAFEMEALRAQINPHFLFNTLNVIKWTAMAARATQVADSITALGRLLSPLFRSDTPLCPLREEVGYVENYIAIMNRRFGEGIGFTVGLDERMSLCPVPRFILQPVVENCILHGLGRQRNRVDIRLEGRAEGDDLLLTVADDGEGMAADRLREVLESLNGPGEPSRAPGGGKQVGLANVNHRIRLLFGDRYGISITSDPVTGTAVSLRIPFATAS